MNFYGLRIALLLKVDEESAVDEEGGACDRARSLARNTMGPATSSGATPELLA